jgi:hypothetical protein
VNSEKDAGTDQQSPMFLVEKALQQNGVTMHMFKRAYRWDPSHNTEGSLTQCCPNKISPTSVPKSTPSPLQLESNLSTRGTDAYRRLLAVVVTKVLLLFVHGIFRLKAPAGVAGGGQATVFGVNVSDLETFGLKIR